MSVNPRLLRIRLQRLEDSPSMADLAEQAEAFARSLPPEKNCRNNTWTVLRSSGLLEELTAMVTITPRDAPRPTKAEARWMFASIGALYHSFRAMDMKPDGAAELTLVRRYGLMVSQYVERFESPTESWAGISQVRREILLLVHRLCAPAEALPEKIDESFLGSLEYAEMASIILANIFDPIQFEDPRQLDMPVVLAGSQILSTYGKTRGFSNTIAEAFVNKYGAKAIARRCIVIIESISASVKKLVYVSALIQYLLFAPSFKRVILEDCAIHLRLMKRWWETQRKVDEKARDFGMDQLLFFSDVVALLDASRDTERTRSTATRDLAREQDLILAIGLGLSKREGFELGLISGEPAERLYHSVAYYCRNDFSLMNVHIKPIWLHVMDCLRLIKRCPNSIWKLYPGEGTSGLNTWQALGTKLGLSEASLRSERAQIRQEMTGGLVGCFFLRCPLYGEDINGRPDPPLRCTGCRSAMYCSLMCQKLHWRHGHRDACGSHVQ